MSAESGSAGGKERQEPADRENRWRSLALPRDLMTVAAGFAIALAAVRLIETVVFNLITPLIAAFVGEPIFELNEFMIRGSEFKYGVVINAAIVFALVAAAVYFLVVPHRRRQESITAEAQAASTLNR